MDDLWLKLNQSRPGTAEKSPQTNDFFARAVCNALAEYAIAPAAPE
jgi:hypothetical protein